MRQRTIYIYIYIGNKFKPIGDEDGEYQMRNWENRYLAIREMMNRRRCLRFREISNPFRYQQNLSSNRRNCIAHLDRSTNDKYASRFGKIYIYWSSVADERFTLRHPSSTILILNFSKHEITIIRKSYTIRHITTEAHTTFTMKSGTANMKVTAIMIFGETATTTTMT